MSARTEPAWTPPAMLVEIAAGDDELIPGVIAAFRQDTANRLVSARSALSSSDRARLRTEIHSIKGGARQVGAESFAGLCQQIEMVALEAPAAELAQCLNGLETKFHDLSLEMTRHFSSSQSSSGPQ
jgi:HPt (histidine-containing phosphotransfer) domain-containing protein